jgi:hypothetical protein
MVLDLDCPEMDVFVSPPKRNSGKRQEEGSMKKLQTLRD